jgi:hypothetical protein
MTRLQKAKKLVVLIPVFILMTVMIPFGFIAQTLIDGFLAGMGMKEAIDEEIRVRESERANQRIKDIMKKMNHNGHSVDA